MPCAGRAAEWNKKELNGQRFQYIIKIMRKNTDLLNGNILTALTELAVPIMATSLVQMAYNLTDMAWIGRVGSSAVAAVGAAGMYTWLSAGVVTLAKIGGQVKVAQSLGEGDKEEAAHYGSAALQMTVFLGILYGLLMAGFTRPLLGFFQLSDETAMAQAADYLKIAGGLILFTFLNQTFTCLFTATGNSRPTFFANCVGLAANMVLDPLLIFGLGPIPAMGAAGAAVATVTAQAIVTAAMLWNVRRDRVLFDRVRIFQKIRTDHMKTITAIGLPAALQSSLYCGISMVLTRFVASWGVTAVAVQRVGGQIESISWMAAEGFGTAINAFVAQNYGGGRYSRVRKGYFCAAGLMVVWGLFTTGLLVFGCGPLFRLFITEPEVVPAGMDYLRIIGYGQLFMCVELMTVGALSGLGKTFRCSVISISLTSARIPLAMVLGATQLKLNGIWWALTISSVLKGFVFFINYMMILKRLPREDRL